jgi:hypothetical protein
MVMMLGLELGGSATLSVTGSCRQEAVMDSSMVPRFAE